MSIGLNDMQSAWQNFNRNNPGWQNQGGGVGAGGAGSLGGFASLQNPPNPINTKATIPGVNSIELPNWMGANSNSQMGELLDTYAGIGAAFDPTDQINARNNAISYNTSAGGQAANNAATEYSSRASQSGSSGLGAGVVKAQAMMPVLSQNATLKTQAADIAAKSHQDATSLASQIAGTISQLRTSYLSTLTGYAQGQQQLALEKFKAESAAAGQNQQTQLGWAQTQADLYKAQMAQQAQQAAQATQQAQAQLATQRPVGTYTTNNQGRITSGQDYYKQLQAWNQAQTGARNSLGGML